jgi:hypothetical protein
VEANRIFKMKRAVLLLEMCALRMQRRWLKHRYPFGLPKYRHRRDEAAMLFQVCVLCGSTRDCLWAGECGWKCARECARECGSGGPLRANL